MTRSMEPTTLDIITTIRSAHEAQLLADIQALAERVESLLSAPAEELPIRASLIRRAFRNPAF